MLTALKKRNVAELRLISALRISNCPGRTEKRCDLVSSTFRGTSALFATCWRAWVGLIWCCLSLRLMKGSSHKHANILIYADCWGAGWRYRADQVRCDRS